MLSLVIATSSAAKLAELRTLLADLPLDLLELGQVVPASFNVAEAFEDNAMLQARAACLASGWR